MNIRQHILLMLLTGLFLTAQAIAPTDGSAAARPGEYTAWSSVRTHPTVVRFHVPEAVVIGTTVTARLFNEHGTEMTSFEALPGEGRLHPSGLPQGIYFLILENEGEYLSGQKFLVITQETGEDLAK